jgi:hypothetical protein
VKESAAATAALPSPRTETPTEPDLIAFLRAGKLSKVITFTPWQASCLYRQTGLLTRAVLVEIDARANRYDTVTTDPELACQNAILDATIFRLQQSLPACWVQPVDRAAAAGQFFAMIQEIVEVAS